MNVPDYVAPIVAYRAWVLRPSGLMSLNGEFWRPKQRLEASCKRSPYRHEPPDSACSCGIYAWKSVDQLQRLGYASDGGVCGEVYLWGTVIEHELGWRAQYAYPKSFVIPPDLVPWPLRKIEAMAEADKRFGTLVALNIDISLQNQREPHVDGEIPLWTTKAGWCHPTLLDRVVVIGDNGGVGIVVKSERTEILYVSHTGEVYSKQRKDIVWRRENRRWETEGLGTATGFRFTRPDELSNVGCEKPLVGQ